MSQPSLQQLSPPPSPRRGHSPRAFTLVELLLALTITAMLSIAAASLLFCTLHTDKFLLSAASKNSEVDLAVSRMIHSLRTCSALDSPTATTTQNTFTIETQPDPTNGLQSYTVVYALSGTQLIETDPRYGANVICNNVTAFNVTLQSTASPITVKITLTSGTDTQVTRTFNVYCRNL